jgi:hypothetical protein
MQLRAALALTSPASWRRLASNYIFSSVCSAVLLMARPPAETSSPMPSTVLQPLRTDIVKSIMAVNPSNQPISARTGRLQLNALAICVPPPDAQDWTFQRPHQVKGSAISR